MLSKYFEIKTNSKKFEDDLLWSMGEIKGKKVILYGAGEGFLELNKKYHFTEELNIVAIADQKFEHKNCCCCCSDCDCEDGHHEHKHEEKTFNGLRAIGPKQIDDEDYEVLLITNEKTRPILKYIFNELETENKDVRTVFNEEIENEAANLNYLYKMNFDKTLPKLIDKLQNKTVLLYGADAFLELIKKYFDISKLNIIGITDKKFENHEENEEWQGYKVYASDEIKKLNPDYVLVATKFYINIIEELYYDTLKDTKIKIRPLLKKSFMTLLKEIWR